MFAALEATDYTIITIIAAFCIGAAVLLRPSDRSRLVRVERKLDAILQHLGITYPDPNSASALSTEVRKLADEGRKIEAIKVYRAETGQGLKDAKDAVESYLGER